jgi:hypothetical protein
VLLDVSGRIDNFYEIYQNGNGKIYAVLNMSANNPNLGIKILGINI